MYKLTKGWPQHIESGAHISPMNPEYLAWLEAGNVPEPYSPSVEELNAPIIAQLAELDIKRSRPLEEIVLSIIFGEPVPLYAKAKLADIKKQGDELRAKIKK